VTITRAAERIQFCYPQVYHACHTRHERARSSESALSMRDSAILVHLDRAAPRSLTDLALHMGLSRSTLSEAVTKLEAFGYAQKAPAGGGDKRQIRIILTAKGVEAVRRNSVLESRRLHAVLRRLPARERAQAVAGLETLARACRPALEPRGRA
jgi:DNA-binding MarR family transcriptional regulator